MQKRAFERIPLGREATFFVGNGIYKGIIKDVSEKGMFINAKICFPFDAHFDLLLPLEDQVFKVSVKVVRIVKTDGFYNGMGVELVNPPSDYLDILKKLKSNLHVL